MNQHLLNAMEELAVDYTVNDIIAHTAKCIFVLESPHVQELKYGAPVAGLSGASMTKHLFGEEYLKFPLGLLVKKNVDEKVNRPTLNRIGLMNVCNIPMQGAAYRDLEVHRRRSEFLKLLESIRSKNNTSKYANESLNILQQIIVDRFVERLDALKDRSCTFIPCGKFAQKFFRLANVGSERWTIIDGVPHPSYNSWDREQYRNVVQKVQATVHSSSCLL